MCPYKDPKDREKLPDYHKKQMIRQRARRKMDAKGIDRSGKDVDHIHGTEAGNGDGNIRLRSRKSNRADNWQDPTKIVGRPKKKK